MIIYFREVLSESELLRRVPRYCVNSDIIMNQYYYSLTMMSREGGYDKKKRDELRGKAGVRGVLNTSVTVDELVQQLDMVSFLSALLYGETVISRSECAIELELLNGGLDCSLENAFLKACSFDRLGAYVDFYKYVNACASKSLIEEYFARYKLDLKDDGKVKSIV